MKKEKNSKNRELTIYMRVKDHLTHDDIDSTLTARLLLAKDSSFVDSAKIAKTNYQGQRFTYAQAVLKDAGKYLMEIKANGYADRYVSVDIPKLCVYHRSRCLCTWVNWWNTAIRLPCSPIHPMNAPRLILQGKWDN